MLLVGLGEIEGALDAIEEALQGHGGFAFVFAVDPIYDPLCKHPRFRGFLDTIGLSQVAMGMTKLGNEGRAAGSHPLSS
jgi:hypothetical protein